MMIMATTAKKAATAKADKVKADPFAKVTDNYSGSSAELVWDLMGSEADYATRVQTQGTILAKRIANGEKNATIARELVAIAKAKGQVISQNTAAKKISRYQSIGLAILKAKPKNEVDMSKVIASASAKARGAKTNPPKSNDEKASAMLDSIIKLIAKCSQAELEKLDTAVTTVIVDAIASRYAELEAINAA
jgi:hypothetical protein